jgi:biofilm PGA synthesis lipoprotein PgaB
MNTRGSAKSQVAESRGWEVRIDPMKGYSWLIFLVCGFLMMMGNLVWSGGAADGSPVPSNLTGLSHRRLEPKKGSGAEKILAAQVSLFYAQSLEEVEERIRLLAEAGVNTLIVRVFQNSGDRVYWFATPRYPSGVYFQTSHAPVVDDVLGPVVRIAHRYGLKIFAWMTTRHANYGLEDKKRLRVFRYDFEKKRIAPAKGFNLFHREVVTHLEGLYVDLARYPIDGILFQDDLILRHNEGFSPEARRLFSQDHGYVPEPSLFYGEVSREEGGRIVVSGYTDRFWIWAGWKNQRILNLAQALMAAGRAVNPNLRFALNLYYEAVLDPEKGMAWYAQSLEVARNYPFDYFSIMAYHRQMQEELGLTMEETISLMPQLAERAVAMAGEPARVLMKVQVADWNDSRLLPQEETETVLRTVGRRKGIHIAIVPYQPDFPMDTLIRSLPTDRIQAKEERDAVGPTAMREPRPRFYPR